MATKECEEIFPPRLREKLVTARSSERSMPLGEPFQEHIVSPFLVSMNKTKTSRLLSAGYDVKD